MLKTAINEKLAADLGVSYLGLRLAQQMNRLLYGYEQIDGSTTHYQNKVATALAGLADCQKDGSTIDSTARAMFETFHPLNSAESVERFASKGYHVDWDSERHANDPKSEWIIWSKWLHERFAPMPPNVMAMMDEIANAPPTA